MRWSDASTHRPTDHYPDLLRGDDGGGMLIHIPPRTTPPLALSGAQRLQLPSHCAPEIPLHCVLSRLRRPGLEERPLASSSSLSCSSPFSYSSISLSMASCCFTDSLFTAHLCYTLLCAHSQPALDCGSKMHVGTEILRIRYHREHRHRPNALTRRCQFCLSR